MLRREHSAPYKTVMRDAQTPTIGIFWMIVGHMVQQNLAARTSDLSPSPLIILQRTSAGQAYTITCWRIDRHAAD